MARLHRRRFMQAGAAGTLSLAAAPQASAASGKVVASERVRVGMVGAGGRAASLNRSFAANREVEIVAVADVDLRRLPATLEAVEDQQGTRPRGVQDYRRLLDDPSLDALVVGTPDHWHAIPTIQACQAGLDVYVEKPDGHNIVEGRRMVEAMRRHARVIQMGSQHRSTERLQSALRFIETGALGRCLVAKAWESSRQGSIGRPADGNPPAEVDYDMWLGPAPVRPFNPRRFHGNWRWFFDYGTGDLGNDGVHRLDMALAALQAAADAEGEGALGPPEVIQASGGKWYFDDMQEFPDTLQVSYTFGGPHSRLLTYEMRIWAPYSMDGESEGAAVYGDQGYIILGNSGWRAFTSRNALVAQGAGGSHEAPHVQNFVDCIKSRERPACDLERVGHPASILCHAGNIAARLGRQLRWDPATESFVGDDQANALRGRPEWRAPYVLPEV